jgi:hypothetical protein
MSDAGGKSMATQPAFSFPRQWEDWASWLLGIWLLLSPWILLFEPDAPALRNAVVVAILVLAVEVVELSIFRTWEEWLNVLLGAWLIVSPWVLGVSSKIATANFVVVGALVLALALYEIRSVRPEPPSL